MSSSGGSSKGKRRGRGNKRKPVDHPPPQPANRPSSFAEVPQSNESSSNKPSSSQPNPATQKPQPSNPATREPQPSNPGIPEPQPSNSATQEPQHSNPATQEPRPSNTATQEPQPSNPATEELQPSNSETREPQPSNLGIPEPQPSIPATQEPQPSNPAIPEPQPSIPATQEPQPSNPAIPEPQPSIPATQEPQPSNPAIPEPQPSNPAAQEARPSNPATQEPQPSQWDNDFVRQLEDILIKRMHTIFADALKQLVALGYTEEVAQKAIFRMGLYGGGKDIVANIVYDALDKLKSGKDVDSVKDAEFENVDQMVKYTLVEIVNVLALVKPKLNISEAMWNFLLVDLDIIKAIEMKGDLLEELTKEISAMKGSSDSALPKSEAQSSQPSPIKFGSFSSSYLKKDLSHPGTSGDANRTLTEEDLATLKYLLDGVMEKEKVIKGSSKSRTKGSTSKSKGKMEAPSNASSAVSTSKGSSKSSASVSGSIQGTVSEKSPPLKPEASSTQLPKASDYCAGIPYDETLGKYVPRDMRDEIILHLVSRIEGLQNKVQHWNDWARKKVMEVTTRLTRDRLEIKELKKEKEEAEKVEQEIKLSEEKAEKRILEIENEIVNSALQVSAATDKVIKLEAERGRLWEEMEAAKLQAAEASAKSEKALAREQKAIKEAQSVQGQKIKLQEELQIRKQISMEMQQKVSQAEKAYNEILAKLKQEKEEEEELLKQSAAIRHEREQLEIAAKAEEDRLKQHAEQQLKKYAEEIKNTEQKIFEMKLKLESSRMGGLRGETSREFMDTFGISGVKRERECVMCLSEEACVAFLPCAHQVLCRGCNEIHEGIGTINCPSCRGRIQKRILVRFARPRDISINIVNQSLD